VYSLRIQILSLVFNLKKGPKIAPLSLMAKLFLLMIFISYTSQACTFCRSAVSANPTPTATTQPKVEQINTRAPAKQSASNLSGDFFSSKPNSANKVQKTRSLRIINSGIYE
jgi:hypothetical protein